MSGRIENHDNCVSDAENDDGVYYILNLSDKELIAEVRKKTLAVTDAMTVINACSNELQRRHMVQECGCHREGRCA